MPVFNTTPVQISQLADQYAVRRIILSVFDDRVDEVHTYKRPRWVCLKDPENPKILCAVYSEKGKKKLEKAIEAKSLTKISKGLKLSAKSWLKVCFTLDEKKAKSWLLSNSSWRIWIPLELASSIIAEYKPKAKAEAKKKAEKKTASTEGWLDGVIDFSKAKAKKAKEEEASEEASEEESEEEVEASAFEDEEETDSEEPKAEEPKVEEPSVVAGAVADKALLQYKMKCIRELKKEFPSSSLTEIRELLAL